MINLDLFFSISQATNFVKKCQTPPLSSLWHSEMEWQNAMYSRTLLYRTRIIWTSAYIEVGLWSRPPAITKGRKRHRINRTRLYRSLGYFKYTVAPSSMPSFISKWNTSKLCSSCYVVHGHLGGDCRSASEMRHQTPVNAEQCQVIDPSQWRPAADALSHPYGYNWLSLQSVQWS